MHPFGLGRGDQVIKVSRRMREEMQALVETLKVMRAEGVQSVYLQDETLEILRKLATPEMERPAMAAPTATTPVRPPAEPRKAPVRAPDPEGPHEMSLPLVTASPTPRARPRPGAPPGPRRRERGAAPR
ncbi:MAG: hypothetical protein JJT96_11865, partial [Opitutales bacterium]|nr:hypothetical protein [Opitutales bacterium]